MRQPRRKGAVGDFLTNQIKMRWSKIINKYSVLGIPYLVDPGRFPRIFLWCIYLRLLSTFLFLSKVITTGISYGVPGSPRSYQGSRMSLIEWLDVIADCIISEIVLYQFLVEVRQGY